MNIFSKLNKLTNLTENEKTLVSYMQDNPESFVKMSALEISEACFISTSTIYRLCQKLDLTGLSELKVQVSASINEYLKENNSLDYNYPFNQNETQNQIISKMKELYEQTLVSSLNLIDPEQLKLISNVLKNTQHIDFYTSAGNIYFAENFKFQMQEIGTFINVPIEEYHQLLTASTSNENHIAIIVSFEGRGIIIERIASILKTNKTPIILISSTNENSLTKYANYHLYLSSNENHFNKISSFSTRLSLLYILDCIYTCYFKFNYDKNVQYKLDAYKQLSEK
ncbi:DNA-binding MurR/RpiR family transcriptional regulator [Clostridium saccharoperbutylacetonicum]|uniref:Transcriptional regulator, RpiR family n=1 Tax=Clostridium saccharoperbutylacetonicum N1-4(HMT) TaxID=931276 RepID=M1MIC9_9CLOT|nr:MurR/RpiR family transcriptional regulator [Clostridium saccharoperbutylacetonicum]AGF56083.1 transcriptional regulator, RpiR family [Clostridium saccharoperbutylacetonicum N1-4(HMT)]NRT63177.1 DNA-binding MurR/RpiR family transcriptional regulator [Clostridium saccharoperbutylacetonicum]NSB26537.1 DNA-binding MurR/RpiR family transcriptional regulator [Clostridium saccharoperbutylacetonicum]NSB45887.1 DNA-binding MurR/RpiR family transcriptional regulator [Clostridium saccharoperbutylaceton